MVDWLDGWIDWLIDWLEIKELYIWESQSWGLDMEVPWWLCCFDVSPPWRSPQTFLGHLYIWHVWYIYLHWTHENQLLINTYIYIYICLYSYTWIYHNAIHGWYGLCSNTFWERVFQFWLLWLVFAVWSPVSYQVSVNTSFLVYGCIWGCFPFK